MDAKSPKSFAKAAKGIVGTIPKIAIPAWAPHSTAALATRKWSNLTQQLSGESLDSAKEGASDPSDTSSSAAKKLTTTLAFLQGTVLYCYLIE